MAEWAAVGHQWSVPITMGGSKKLAVVGMLCVMPLALNGVALG